MVQRWGLNLVQQLSRARAPRGSLSEFAGDEMLLTGVASSDSVLSGPAREEALSLRCLDLFIVGHSPDVRESTDAR